MTRMSTIYVYIFGHSHIVKGRVTIPMMGGSYPVKLTKPLKENFKFSTSILFWRRFQDHDAAKAWLFLHSLW